MSQSSPQDHVLAWPSASFAPSRFSRSTLSIVREQIIEQQQETRDRSPTALSARPALLLRRKQRRPMLRPRLKQSTAADHAEHRRLAVDVRAGHPGRPDPLAARRGGASARERSCATRSSSCRSRPSYLACCSSPSSSRRCPCLFKNVGLFVLAIYDAIIFAPLWVERRRGHERRRRRAAPAGRRTAATTMTMSTLFVLEKKSTPEADRNRNATANAATGARNGSCSRHEREAICWGLRARSRIAALSACGLVTSTSRSVFLVFDVSGTYVKAVPDATKLANITVAELLPGDLHRREPDLRLLLLGEGDLPQPPAAPDAQPRRRTPSVNSSKPSTPMPAR